MPVAIQDPTTALESGCADADSVGPMRLAGRGGLDVLKPFLGVLETTASGYRHTGCVSVAS